MPESIESIIEAAVARGVAKALAEQPRPPSAPDGPPTMSVKQAAAYAGVSTPTVYNWTHREDCTFVLPVGRNKKILRHKFIEWLDKQAGGDVVN